MLPGHIETGVKHVLSLQVCAVDKSRIFLSVLGLYYNYPWNKSDLYDLSDLMKDVTIPNEMIQNFEFVSVSDLKSKEAELFQTKKTISQQEDRIHKLCEENRSIPLLENKLKQLELNLKQKERDCDTLIKKTELLSDKNQQLEKKLTQSQSQHQSLLNEHQTLQNNYNQLNKNISSQEENTKLLLKTNEDVNEKLLKAESKITQSEKLRQDLLDETKSLKSLLLKQKTKSDAKIAGLLKKLSILNSKRKGIAVSSKGRQSKHTHQPDFPELIRGLEDRLSIKNYRMRQHQEYFG